MPGRRPTGSRPARLLDLPIPLLEDILRAVSQDSARDWAATTLACRALHAAGKAAEPLPLIEASEQQLQGLCRAAVRHRRRRGSGVMPQSGKLCGKLVVQPTSIKAAGHQLHGMLGALNGVAAPEELVIQWLSGWQYTTQGAHRVVHLIHVALAQMSGLRRLSLQLRNVHTEASFHGGMMHGLRSLQDLQLEFDSPMPQVELHGAVMPHLTRLHLAHAHSATQMPPPSSHAIITPRLLPALQLLELRSWHAIVLTTSDRPLTVPQLCISGPCIQSHYPGVGPLFLAVDRCLTLPNVDYSQLSSLKLSRVATLEQFLYPAFAPAPGPAMPQLVALEVGDGVGREGQVEAMVAACQALGRVSRQEGAVTFQQYCTARGLSTWRVLADGVA